MAARELFRQGTEDVDAGRFAKGLEKFKRVAAVKETANVRFNIARCEEALNKTGAALADYETAESEANADDNARGGDALAKLAHDKADALRPRVPRLGLVTWAPATAGLVVTLDGARIALTTLGVPLPVDPGPHAVDATAPGRQPFHASVTLAEGDSSTVTIILRMSEAPPPVTAPPPHRTGDPSSPRAVAGPSHGSARATAGILTLVAGGLMGAGSLVTLLMHNDAVAQVRSDCPQNSCPLTRAYEINSLETRANTTGTLSTGFIVGASVAGAVGVYLLLSASTSQNPSAMVAPGSAGAPAGLSLMGRF